MWRLGRKFLCLLVIFWAVCTCSFATAAPDNIQLHPLALLGNEYLNEEERARRVREKPALFHCASGKLFPPSWHECGAGHVC